MKSHTDICGRDLRIDLANCLSLADQLGVSCREARRACASAFGSDLSSLRICPPGSLRITQESHVRVVHSQLEGEQGSALCVSALNCSTKFLDMRVDGFVVEADLPSLLAREGPMVSGSSEDPRHSLRVTNEPRETCKSLCETRELAKANFAFLEFREFHRDAEPSMRRVRSRRAIAPPQGASAGKGRRGSPAAEPGFRRPNLAAPQTREASGAYA